MSAVLPQFLSSASPAVLPVLFAMTTALVSLGVMTGYGLLMSTFTEQLRSGWLRRCIDGVFGAVLVGLGARLATQPRP